MKSDRSYISELLQTWEETYKKGQLTLWLLMALKERPRYATEVREFIYLTAGGTIGCEEQSVYRALRKFYDLEIVDFELRDGNSGPSRKYYFLTEIGSELLKTFIERNIKVMYSRKLSKMFMEEG